MILGERRFGLRKIGRIFLIINLATAILWMGMQFRPSPDEAIAKVFDRIASYSKIMPDYMFEQDDDSVPRKVKVNGHQTYLTVQQSDDEIHDILDFYAEQYKPIQLDMPSVEAIGDNNGSFTSDQAQSALDVLNCMRKDQHFRYEGDNYGLWGAFEFKDKNLKIASEDYLESLSKAMETGALGKIGTFRVTMAIKRGESGGARIINLWTDEDFNLNNLQPDETGDIPGDDIEDVPRYSGAVRQLSVAQENVHTLDRVVVYEAEGTVVSHILFYHARMRTGGWETDPAFEKVAKEKSIENLMFYRRSGRECNISIDEDMDSGKTITTIMDRKTTNG